MKLSAKHTLHVQPEGYQEPHNNGLQAHPALSHQWHLNWESIQVCVLPVMLLDQPPHMKNKKNKKNIWKIRTLFLLWITWLEPIQMPLINLAYWLLISYCI